jgi:hypothetical protein
LIVCPAAVL